MILIIIGLLIATIGRFSLQNIPQAGNFKHLPLVVGSLVAIFGLASATIVVVDPGKVGVQTLFGKVNNAILTSGLKIINPFAEVKEFDVRTQNYTMSGVHDEGQKSGDDAIRVLSKDGLEVTIDVSVLYRVIPDQAPKILSSIGVDYEEKIVRPLARTRIRDKAVYYDAVSLFSEKRDEFQDKIFKSIEADFKERGLFLEQLLVRNIMLPQSVKTVIESKINAEQESQKMIFILEKEKQEAERKRVEAQGIADYQRIMTTTLTDKQLQYEMIQAYKALSQSENSKIVVMGGGKNPIILDTGSN